MRSLRKSLLKQTSIILNTQNPKYGSTGGNGEATIERSLVFENGTEVFKLIDHFINWQNPTQEEIVMFELQTGIKYLNYWLGLREE